MMQVPMDSKRRRAIVLTNKTSTMWLAAQASHLSWPTLTAPLGGFSVPFSANETAVA